MTDDTAPDDASAPGPEPAPEPPPVVHLSEPFNDLASWVRYFSRVEIPVLAQTAAALEELRAMEDEVDAGMLAAVIQADPLMTIKAMAHAASLRKPGDATEPESVTSSLVMTGIAPFFRRFGTQPTVEDRLRDHPKALLGLQDLLLRGRRGAHFAMAFAVHRGDTDASVIHQAAMLYDFAEVLMWCHAPTMQLEIRAMQRANPTLRSVALQQFVYTIELDDLRQALMKVWHLPALLVRICDGKHMAHPSVRNVVLAVRLARHTTEGWENPALPDDVNDIAQLLNAPPRVALAFLRKVNLAD
ncbi:MAG: HDOD domain-containing protein [Burkholderiales bacterium]|nr:HDOD domain-containing protein [Burkholderiales bacterium]